MQEDMGLLVIFPAKLPKHGSRTAEVCCSGWVILAGSVWYYSNAMYFT